MLLIEGLKRIFDAVHSGPEFDKVRHFLKVSPNELKLSGIVVGISTTQNQKENFFWNVAVVNVAVGNFVNFWKNLNFVNINM